MLQDFMDWVNQNYAGIITLIITGSVGTAVLVLKKQLAVLAQKFISAIVKIVVKIFGGSVDEDSITQNFSELPFIADLKAVIEESQMRDELRLVELKKRILSPKLSNLERIAVNYEYEQLFKYLDGKISSETMTILSNMEQVAAQENI